MPDRERRRRQTEAEQLGRQRAALIAAIEEAKLMVERSHRLLAELDERERKLKARAD